MSATYAICPSCRRSVARGATACGVCGASVIVGAVPAPKPGNAASVLAVVSLTGIALLLCFVVPILGVPLLLLIGAVVVVKVIARAV